MKDKWSTANEVVQNVLALAVVGVYLYMVLRGMTVPFELTAFAGGVLLFFGFRAYKATNNGGPNPPTS